MTVAAYNLARFDLVSIRLAVACALPGIAPSNAYRCKDGAALAGSAGPPQARPAPARSSEPGEAESVGPMS